MKTNLVWEDEAKNRVVNFEVNFSIENGKLDIDSLSATRVTFTCPVSNVALRSIGVHTDKGRTLLADRFEACGKLDELVSQLADRHELSQPS